MIKFTLWKGPSGMSVVGGQGELVGLAHSG